MQDRKHRQRAEEEAGREGTMKKLRPAASRRPDPRRTAEPFAGFSPEATAFLAQLERRNERKWFEAHRDVYERELVAPMRELVRRLASTMLAIDLSLDVQPAIGRTVSRIHRDVRFSRDKSPFHTRIWLVFRRRGEEMRDSPAYFFELGSEDHRYGMGWYAASPATMAAFRRLIEAEPDWVLAQLRAIPRDRFELSGDLYARRMGEGLPPALQDVYQRKNLYFARGGPNGPSALGPALARTLQRDYEALVPMYAALRRALERYGEQQRARSVPTPLGRG